MISPIEILRTEELKNRKVRGMFAQVVDFSNFGPRRMKKFRMLIENNFGSLSIHDGDVMEAGYVPGTLLTREEHDKGRENLGEEFQLMHSETARAKAEKLNL